jgi:hypothetical protein
VLRDLRHDLVLHIEPHKLGRPQPLLRERLRSPRRGSRPSPGADRGRVPARIAAESRRGSRPSPGADVGESRRGCGRVPARIAAESRRRCGRVAAQIVGESRRGCGRVPARIAAESRRGCGPRAPPIRSWPARARAACRTASPCASALPAVGAALSRRRWGRATVPMRTTEFRRRCGAVVARLRPSPGQATSDLQRARPLHRSGTGGVCWNAEYFGGTRRSSSRLGGGLFLRRVDEAEQPTPARVLLRLLRDACQRDSHLRPGPEFAHAFRLTARSHSGLVPLTPIPASAYSRLSPIPAKARCDWCALEVVQSVPDAPGFLYRHHVFFHLQQSSLSSGSAHSLVRPVPDGPVPLKPIPERGRSRLVRAAAAAARPLPDSASSIVASSCCASAGSVWT